jgi:hypothetical protein
MIHHMVEHPAPDGCTSVRRLFQDEDRARTYIRRIKYTNEFQLSRVEPLPL